MKLRGCFSKKSGENEVHKFTLKDYDATYEVTLSILKILGMRLTRKDSKLVQCCTAYYWFEFSNILLEMFLEIASMMKSAQGGTFDDIVDIFTMIPCVIYVFLALVKSGKLMCNRPVFANLIRELKELWPQEELMKEDYLIIKKELTHLHRVINGYYWANVILILIFATPSFFTAAMRLLGFDVNAILPFIIWLPFDPLQKYVYPFVLVWMTWQGSATLLCVISGDLLCVVLLCHISTQFDLLASRVRRTTYVPVDHQMIREYPLGSATLLCVISGDLLCVVLLCHISTQFDLLASRVRRTTYVPVDHQMIREYPLGLYGNYLQKTKGSMQSIGEEDLEKHYQAEISQIVIRHRTLIRSAFYSLYSASLILRLAGDMENMCSFSFLVNFLNSSIVICFSGFCCVVVEKWSEPAYKIYMVSALAQTWLLCWYGQRLLDSSGGVADALYASGWYKTSTKISKSILIMLHRSQKKMCVTTYGFSAISMETFATILKTSWSYFTLLLKFYSK